MKGSKYVQSDLEGIFRQVKNDLMAGFNVLFSGTPCQIAGLKSYIGKKSERIFILSILYAMGYHLHMCGKTTFYGLKRSGTAK